MKLRVVGVSGSGKSSLAVRIAAQLHRPRLELDAVFWDAGWTYRDLDEALGLIRDFAAQHPDDWVVDGNWTSRLDGLLDPGTPGGADTFVWLDHPRSSLAESSGGRCAAASFAKSCGMATASGRRPGSSGIRRRTS